MQTRRAPRFYQLHPRTARFMVSQALPRRFNFPSGVIRQPFGLRNQQFVRHLPDFFRIANRAHQRVMQHRLLEQGHIAMHSRFHRHLLHAYTRRAGRGACQRQIAHYRHIDAILVYISRNLYNAVIG